jgi:hypothetical protein
VLSTKELEQSSVLAQEIFSAMEVDKMTTEASSETGAKSTDRQQDGAKTTYKSMK